MKGSRERGPFLLHFFLEQPRQGLELGRLRPDSDELTKKHDLRVDTIHGDKKECETLCCVINFVFLRRY